MDFSSDGTKAAKLTSHIESVEYRRFDTEQSFNDSPIDERL